MEMGIMHAAAFIYKVAKMFAGLIRRIGKMGLSRRLSEDQYRMGYAFNQINFTALLISLTRGVIIILLSGQPVGIDRLAINMLPSLCCLFMMISMLLQAYEIPFFFYFLVFPPVLLFIILFSHERGMIAFFIPYLTYPFYFLRRAWKVRASFVLSSLMLVFATVTEVFGKQVSRSIGHNGLLEIFDLVGAIMICFITNNSIKFQVLKFEKKILRQKQILAIKNENIRIEKEKLYDSNRIKDKLFSIISHDLRIPIISMRLLIDQIDIESNIEELIVNLPEFKGELHKMSRLFEEMLAWSRIQMSGHSIQFEMIDVRQLSLHIIDFVERRACEKNIRIVIDIKSPIVYGDKDIIEIVLRNLTSNAVKFTASGGMVKITGYKTKDIYVFELEDSGVGIEPQVLGKILSHEFHTSYGTGRESGTGMGLFICRDLLEKCQGSLSIESVPGLGTTVVVSIPDQPREDLEDRRSSMRGVDMFMPDK